MYFSDFQQKEKPAELAFRANTGIARFELAHEGTRNLCLTAWLYPNFNKNNYTKSCDKLQKFTYERVWKIFLDDF